MEKIFYKIGKHSFLIALAIMFAFPFVWMICTSAKVDREMFSEKRTLLPKPPDPKIVSPYIDSEIFQSPKKPKEVSSDQFSRFKNSILKTLKKETSAAELPIKNNLKIEAENETVEGLFERVTALTPNSFWTNSIELPDNIIRRVTSPKKMQRIFDKCYRRFSIQLSRVRDDDFRNYNLAFEKPITSNWISLTPSAAFIEEKNNKKLPYADIHYSFENTNIICLQAEFELPFPATNFFQYNLGYHSDDTWHRFKITIEIDGKKFTSKEAVYLFDYQWAGQNWQVPSSQDNEIKIKRWIPLTLSDSGEEFNPGKDKIRVILTLQQSSKFQAWIGKITRNYFESFRLIPFWRYLGTSAFLVIINIIGVLFSSTIVAYAFARLRWPGRDFCFMLLLATLMIPPQVIMVPGFIIMKWFGWYNTLQPLWIHSFGGNAFFIFLLRQFMKGIPNDLEDAARIDGCGFLRIYWYVILPLVKPTMAAISIFTFMGVWNNFMGPLIYLSDNRLYPLSLGLFSLNAQAGTSYGVLMAGSFLMTLPIIIIFFFAQKYFIQGVALTGMKG